MSGCATSQESMQPYHLMASYSLFPFLNQSGQMFLWTSSRGCRIKRPGHHSSGGGPFEQIGLKHLFTAGSVAEVFVREIVQLHGIPQSIISDQDQIFISSGRNCSRHKKRPSSTVLHITPRGQTEAVNRCLEAYLRYFRSSKPCSWSQYLPWAEFWYNTSFYTAIKHIPFQIVYVLPPPPVLPFENGTSTMSLVEQDRDEVLQELKMQLTGAQQHMKHVADGKRCQINFKVGELVYLKLRPHHQKSVANRPHSKLSPHYFEPFEIETGVGQVAYKLKLPTNDVVHPVFHVSQFQRAIGTIHTASYLPSQLTSSELFQLEPKATLRIKQNPSIQVGSVNSVERISRI